ncbi:hypothetical protein TVNIR_2083 [Thioalkalivibrio nitratireducens DSM 14787]|uniref:Uncharacterized protein n=1 Tax=Thioalkalivibrio nitratireducens (strain DSM 14787 / UNIQEM 213 / ALEN2) TaxID=1255043 RepID=L0DXH1_THIND|nr:hypothetical protein [Thioalkalivibrio nitratireducens]AGA33743.1 hypothetical protein TVNIR_2083 [Thioalkalivibrio nitratireducens DSM 14787]
MGGSIDSMSESMDRRLKKIMGQVDPADYGIDVAEVDRRIDAELAKVKQPAPKKDPKAGADE